MRLEDNLLTVEQVAQMAHLRPRTIRTKIHQGLLTAHKPPRGKNWLIQRADAEGMLVGGQPQSELRQPVLVDRLGTLQGRARAVAALDRLGGDRDEGEQRESAIQLQEIMSGSRTRLRQWDAETGTIQENGS